ncbi:MAG TPA: hypothetical protein VGF14_03160 [Alphaproteobacteria bacterium]
MKITTILQDMRTKLAHVFGQAKDARATDYTLRNETYNIHLKLTNAEMKRHLSKQQNYQNLLPDMTDHTHKLVAAHLYLGHSIYAKDNRNNIILYDVPPVSTLVLPVKDQDDNVSYIEENTFRRVVEAGRASKGDKPLTTSKMDRFFKNLHNLRTTRDKGHNSYGLITEPLQRRARFEIA